MFNYPIPGQNSFINYQEFNSSGTFYRPKGQKWTRAWIMCVGGGAAGSYYNYGGPGACMMREVFLSDDSNTVTIGAGGSSDNSAGGATLFGSNIVYAAGGSSSGIMGNLTKYYIEKNSKNINSFTYTSYGTDTNRIAARWTYKRQTAVNFSNSNGAIYTYGYNGNSGANSGAGGNKVAGSKGYSGYCIVFYEDTIKNNNISLGTYQHLKKQVITTSGTWYRPQRFPVTLAYICLKAVDSFNRAYYHGGTYFLTDTSYTVTLGTGGGTSYFGDILNSAIDYGDQYCSVDCHIASQVENSTGRIAHFACPELAQTNAWVMWYE